MSDVTLKAQLDDLKRQMVLLEDNCRQASISNQSLRQTIKELQALVESHSAQIQELQKTKSSRGARATKAAT
jgi:regulator of replication initiation timing